MEYAWFNNVETKPGIGYPKEWENQENGTAAGCAKADGSIVPRQGGKWKLLMRISPIRTCRRSTTTTSPSPSTTTTCTRRLRSKAAPTRPRSLITGKRMEKIEWGPNWEEILGGEFSKRSKDANFDGSSRHKRRWSASSKTPS